jgi:hypothetical protein
MALWCAYSEIFGYDLLSSLATPEKAAPKFGELARSGEIDVHSIVVRFSLRRSPSTPDKVHDLAERQLRQGIDAGPIGAHRGIRKCVNMGRLKCRAVVGWRLMERRNGAIVGVNMEWGQTLI